MPNKVVAIIDDPKDCDACPFLATLDNDAPRCDVTYQPIRLGENKCPLKPLPPYLMKTVARYVDGTEKEIYSTDYARGWNACLKEITGEEE